MKQRGLRIVRDAGIAAVFLWLVFRGIDFGEVLASFRSASLPWLCAAVAAFLAGYACRIERWRILLAQDNPRLTWADCAGPLMACVAANNVLPLRAGDLLRAFRFNQRLGIGLPTSLATMLMERLLDLLMVTALLGAALVAFEMHVSQFFGLGGGALVIAAGVLLLVLVQPLLFRPLAMHVARAAGRAVPSLAPRIASAIDHGFSALEYASRAHIMGRLLAWSVAAWLAEGLVFWFGALALPSLAHALAAWLALPLGTLATVLPSAPGFVGTFEYFCGRAMTLLGNAPASATAYALLVHAVLWAPPTLWGGAYLLWSGAGRRQPAMSAP